MRKKTGIYRVEISGYLDHAHARDDTGIGFRLFGEAVKSLKFFVKPQR